MARDYLMAGFLAFVWLASVGCCFLALVAFFRNLPPRFYRGIMPAMAAIVIGVIGVWAPFSWWPQVSYSFSLGGSQHAIDFSWPFAAPLALGVITLLLLLWKKRQRLP